MKVKPFYVCGQFLPGRTADHGKCRAVRCLAAHARLSRAHRGKHLDRPHDSIPMNRVFPHGFSALAGPLN